MPYSCILFNYKLPKTKQAENDSVDHMVHALCNFEKFLNFNETIFLQYPALNL